MRTGRGVEPNQEQEPARARERRYEELARMVVEPLHRYLLRRADAGQVDDVLAETMLVLWRRLDDVPGMLTESAPVADTVLPWCYGVARGCLANARRADTRRLRLLERLTHTAPQAAPAAPADDHEELHAALGTLGDVDREVVQLWAWEELAPRAIAEVTGLSPNAVSIRLHRAKRKLATVLRRDAAASVGHRGVEE
ncbi:sigma-70 family RNA polymerase sigma factor [Streptomyces flaveolus]|uniref:RNA polymerase sigma factor n=1 Tax=Streptomyces flaveolus TaxID=67297 RepID=UPI0033B85F8D